MLEEKKCQGSCPLGRRYCSLSDRGDQDKACSEAVPGPQAACPCGACLKGPSLRTTGAVSTLTGRAQGESGLQLLLTCQQNPWAISVPLGPWLPGLHGAMDGGWEGGQTL